MKKFWLIVCRAACVSASLVSLGVGCVLPEPSSPGSSVFHGLSPQDAAVRLTVRATDTFDIQQTFFGVTLPSLYQKNGHIRTVQLLDFDPSHLANIRWTSSVERESAFSVDAHRAWLERIKQDPKAPEPPTAIEEVATSGTIRSINLSSARLLLPPAYWTPGEISALDDKSAIWLASVPFEELKRTRTAAVNFNVFDEKASVLFKNVSDLQTALDRLRHAVSAHADVDPTLLKTTATSTTWTVNVNGTDVNVATIMAHGWFGDIIVLDNPQNPLILKMQLNPVLFAPDIVKGTVTLESMFGYEIKNFTLHF